MIKMGSPVFSLSVAVPQCGLIILAVMAGSIPSEVQNLAMQMSMRRSIRPTNAFSKNRAHLLYWAVSVLLQAVQDWLLLLSSESYGWSRFFSLGALSLRQSLGGFENESTTSGLPCDSEGLAEELSPVTPA